MQIKIDFIYLFEKIKELHGLSCIKGHLEIRIIKEYEFDYN